jgi:hypothetical protein
MADDVSNDGLGYHNGLRYVIKSLGLLSFSCAYGSSSIPGERGRNEVVIAGYN